MNARRLWTNLILLACGVANAQVITVSDYPRPATSLSPEQQQDMRRVARAVTGVLAPGRRVDVAVFGHADFDQGGRDTELKVSTDRARAAEAAFRTIVADEIGRAGLPAEHINSVATASIGLGTLRPVFPRPANEQERRANRRVEFAWRVNGLPPMPPAEPVFQRCLQVLGVVPEPGPRWRMSCVCNKLMQRAPHVGDNHYDYRARSRLPDTAGGSALTPQWPTVEFHNVVRHLREDILVAAQGVWHHDFARRLVVLDDALGRNIDNFHSQLLGESAPGLLDRAIDSDIQNRMGDPNHTYSCYAGYSRARHDQ